MVASDLLQRLVRPLERLRDRRDPARRRRPSLLELGRGLAALRREGRLREAQELLVRGAQGLAGESA